MKVVTGKPRAEQDSSAESKRCPDCKKKFHTPTDLARHRGRKKPCTPRAGGVLCGCGKSFSSKSNLARHSKSCTGVTGLVADLQKQIDQLTAQVNNMRSHEVNITINFNNYNNPRLDHVTITQDDLLTDSVTKMIIEKVYFDKSIPENHVLYRPNIRENRLLVRDDNSWKNYVGDELARIFTQLKNIAYNVGHDNLNTWDEAEYRKIYPVALNSIIRFNTEERITDAELMEVITKNRELVRASVDK